MADRKARGRVIIVGGSIAGLFAAATLRTHGWSPDVYERADELADRGAGLTTHKALFEALEGAHLELREGVGVSSMGRILLGRDGTILGTHEMPQVMTSWGHIYNSLREEIPQVHYHNGHVLSGLSVGSDGVVAQFSNGTSAEGDWLIGADGTRSMVRRLVAPEVAINYSGYFIWRGLIDESLVPSEVLAQVAHRMAFGMAPGGHWLGYLVAGRGDALEPGRRRYNWAWYRRADAATLRDHLTDAQGFHHDQGIPHGLVRPELVAAMRREAAEHLAPQICSIIAATEEPFLQPILDLGCERLVYGRVFLIGDAAFTARPHVGLGVSKAAQDASTLAVALSAADLRPALGSWERDRLNFGRAVLQWSRDLGSYIAPPAIDDAERAKAAYYRRPEVLLAATAASEPSEFLDL